MRIATLVYLLSLISVQQLSAQGKTRAISGRLVDEKGKPISSASIFIAKDSLGTPLRGTVSDSLGVFHLKVERADSSLIVWVSALGYKPYRRSLSLDREGTTDMGTLVLEPLAQALSGVSITKRRPLVEQKVDRLVFHAEDFSGAEGGDALAVLQLTPRLLVSNGQVSILGKGPVRLMVDGRMIQLSGEALADYLRTIRAEEIKSVEVIPVPPARYEAAGQSGLVNLILKKPKQNSWNSTLQSSYRQAEYAFGRLSHAFSYRKKDLSLSSSTSYSRGSWASDGSSRIQYPNRLLERELIGRYYQSALRIRAGLDYDLSKNWRIGLQYSGSYGDPPLATDHSQTSLKDTQSNFAYLDSRGQGKTKSDLNTLNLHLIAKLDSIGRKVSVDVDLLNYDAQRKRSFDTEPRGMTIPNFNTDKTSADNTNDRHIKNYAVQVDVEHPLKGLSLDYGLKFSTSKTDNDFRYYDTSESVAAEDPKRSNAFQFEEHIGAVYLSARKALGKKWETKLGLRGENTQTRGNSLTLHQIDTHAYFQLFPTAYLLYRPNSRHSYSLSYGRRISRPSFYQLNPFRFYTSAYAYVSGNPELKPVYTTSLELLHAYNNFLYSSIWYDHHKDASSQITIFKEGYEQATERLNYYEYYATGIYQGIQYKKINWWQMIMTLELFYVHSNSNRPDITPKSTAGFGGSFTTYNDFFFNKAKTCSAGFQFKYLLPYTSGDMRYNYERYYLSAFFKLLLLNRDLQLSIRGNNLTKAYGYNNKSLRKGLAYFNKGYWGDRYVSLSVSYRFGNKKIQVKKHQVSNQAERNRL